jgi:hypothetical protein
MGEIVGLAHVAALGALNRREKSTAMRADPRVLAHFRAAALAEEMWTLQFASFLDALPALSLRSPAADDDEDEPVEESDLAELSASLLEAAPP